MTASTALCRFAHALTLAGIPTAAREHAKLLLLDTLGIALAGIDEPSSRAARLVARLAGGAPHATLLVHGDRVPVAAAALANGTAAFSHLRNRAQVHPGRQPGGGRRAILRVRVRDVRRRPRDRRRTYLEERRAAGFDGREGVGAVRRARARIGPLREHDREELLPVQDDGPGGIFTMDQSGTGQGAILNQDGTVNGPGNPAAKGSVVSIFATVVSRLGRL